MTEAAGIQGMHAELHYGSRVVTCWQDRPGNLAEMLSDSVKRHPQREAIVCGSRRCTYAQLNTEVSIVTAGLRKFGLCAGDRLALHLGNCLEFAVLLFAVARIGAIAVPISEREHRDGIKQRLLDCGAGIVVTQGSLHANLPPRHEIPSVDAVFSLGAGTGLRDYDDLRAHGNSLVQETVAEDAPAILIYTSGTTGHPKGAVLSGFALVNAAMNYGYVFGLGPEDRNVVVAPMSHVTGLTGGLLASVTVGAKTIIMDGFKTAAFLELARRERMTVTVMVPAMYNLCLIQDNLDDHDLSSWRVGGYGGASMPGLTIERFAAHLPDLRLMNCYGATETSSPITFMPPEFLQDRLLSIGLPAPGADVRIMDEDGHEVAPGQEGELWLYGSIVAPGYWQNEEATQREFVGGYWKSGDIGKKDEQGFIFLLDRKKDFINRGGFKIPSVMIENALLAIPGVIEAAVIARPCTVLGERIHAVIHTDSTSITEAQIQQAGRAHLAAREIPESITFYGTPLPRNANGKILKRHLRAELFSAPVSNHSKVNHERK